MLTSHSFTTVRAGIARAVGVVVGASSVAVAGVLLACSPPRFGEAHELDVVMTLAPDESDEVRHFTSFARASEPNVEMEVVLEVDVTVCRTDELPFGPALGVVRLVADAPSIQVEEESLEGESSCLDVRLSMFEDCWSVTEPETRTECRVTVEVAREPGAAPIELEMRASMRAWAIGDGEEPSGFESRLQEDA